MVSSAYAVSWAYIIADVSLEGWKVCISNKVLDIPLMIDDINRSIG